MSHLVDGVKRLRGELRKCSWIGRKHAPDTVVFFRGVYFVELKRPGKDARAGQAREHERMRKHGADVRVLDTIEKVDEFLLELTKKVELK